MSLPWSSKGLKATPVNADELMIIDSADANPATQNKRVSIGTLPISSPLTTKGDIYTFDTDNQRLPVGTNGQVLKANSATPSGLEWGVGGGTQTPWTSDIDAAGFALLDSNYIEADDGKTTLYPTTGALRLKDASAIVWRDAVAGSAGIQMDNNVISFPGVTSYTIGGTINAQTQGANFDFIQVFSGIDFASSSITSVQDIEMEPSGFILLDGGPTKWIQGTAAGVNINAQTGGAIDLKINNVIEYFFDATEFNAGNKLIKAVTDPVDGSDAATKTYVDNLVNGLSWKNPARLATTGNITLSGNQTIDGFLTVTGDRVLVKDQTSGQFNGVYNADTGAWTRTTDTDESDELVNMSIYITAGTTQEDTSWVLTTDPPIIVDTTVLDYAQVGAGAGNPLTTKGDIFGYDTGNARIPVGTDNQFLMADSSDGLGVSYSLVNDVNVAAGRFANITGVASGFNILTDNTTAFFELEANHSVPANGQIVGAIDFYDDDDIGTRTLYAEIETLIEDPTSGSVDARVSFKAKKNNVTTTFLNYNENSLGWVSLNSILSMGNNNIQDVAQIDFTNISMNIEASGPSFMNFNVGSGEFFFFRVNAAPEFSISATEFDFFSNTVTDVGSVEFATVAGLVAANRTYIVNNNNVLKLNVDSAETIQMSVNAALRYTFSDTDILMAGGTNLLMNANGANGYIDLDEITAPANPAGNHGRLYLRDVAGITTLFFKDSVGTETDLLAGGGSQTPWLSNIDASGFDLNNLGILDFASPADVGTQIFADAAGIKLDVGGAADTFQLRIGAGPTVQWEFKNNTLDMFGNGLSDVGSFLDANNNELMIWVGVASAVNYIQIENNTTGNNAVIGAGDVAGDTTAGITFEANLDGGFLFQNRFGQEMFSLVQNATNSNDYVEITNSAGAVTGPLIAVVGSNTDVDLNISGKGVGLINMLSKTLFTPIAALAGLNVGAKVDPDPTTPSNGDIYYNSTNNKFRAYENSVWVDMIGGEVFTWTANHDAAGFDLLNLGSMESNGLNPATIGLVRLADSEEIAWRNAANTQDLLIFSNSDQLNFEGFVDEIHDTSGTIDYSSANELDAGSAIVRVNDLEVGTKIFDTTSTRSEFINMTNDQTISWQKAIAANGWIGIKTTTADVFSIGIAPASGSAFTPKYNFSATSADWLGNTLTNVGIYNSDAAIPADAGAIRLGTSESISWRNAGNTGNNGLLADGEILTTQGFDDFDGDTLTHVNFSNADVDILNIQMGGVINMGGNQQESLSYLEFDSIASPGVTGFATRGRLFLDSGNANHLTIIRNGSPIDLEAGAEVTTWTADHNQAGFDLVGKATNGITLGQGATDVLSITYLDDTLDAGVRIGNTDGFVSITNESAVVNDAQTVFTMRSGGANTLQNVMNFTVPNTEDTGTVPYLRMNFEDSAGGTAGRPLLEITNAGTLWLEISNSTNWTFHSSTTFIDLQNIIFDGVTNTDTTPGTFTSASLSLAQGTGITWDGAAPSTPNSIGFGVSDQFQVFINNAVKLQVLATQTDFSGNPLTGAGSLAFTGAATSTLDGDASGIIIDSTSRTLIQVNNVDKYSFDASFLDMNGLNIRNLAAIRGDLTGTNEILTFSEVASALNEVNIINSITGVGPTISAQGTDANIDLNIAAKGAGQINLLEDVVVSKRFQGAKGADVVSATTINPQDGNYFDITAANTINHMITTGWQIGSVVIFQFDAGATVAHNTGTDPANTVSFFLAGAVNFVATADDTLTVIYDGGFWRETSRSIN